jgi:hypothetical protein
MQWYHTVLLVGAVLCAALNFSNRRGLIALCLVSVAYLSSIFWWRFDMPYPIIFSGACDASAALVIYFWAKYKWELALFRIFQSMLLINIIYGFGWAAPIIYQSSLELANLAALILIAGQPYFDRIGSHVRSGAWGIMRVFCRAAHSLQSKRKDTPFIWIKG